MIREKEEFNIGQLGDIQNDLIHFESLIGDLIGILSKSISFCIHSGDSINSLLSHYLVSTKEAKKESVDSTIIIKEDSYIKNPNIKLDEFDDDNGVEYIRFSSSGVLYSLPKRILKTFEGSYLFDQSEESQRTSDRSIYLDYPNDDSCAPLVIDTLLNKKINVDKLSLRDQYSLLDLIEFCGLPIPEELIICKEKRDMKKKKYENGDKVQLIINNEKNIKIKNYLITNGLWKDYILAYDNGFIDYNSIDDYFYINKKYIYIDLIYGYLKTESINMNDEMVINIDMYQLENEIYSIFGDKGKATIEKYLTKKTVVFKNSRILENGYIETKLLSWLGNPKKMKLLFRASEHDFLASEFHKYCDNKGETVTIIKHIGNNNHINIFGGYTNQSWDSSNRWKMYSKEFLFTLSNEHNIPPTKYENQVVVTSIFCLSSSGPIFGGGYDISISDQCHINSNSGCFAHSFEEENTNQKSSLFVNTNKIDTCNNFVVEEYEVWGRD
ncbi:hypothetical protein WA158_005344 [Blastocystis sp. Blastoise]